MRNIAAKLIAIKDQRIAVKNALVAKQIAAETATFDQLVDYINGYQGGSQSDQYTGIDTRQQEPIISIIRLYQSNDFIGTNKKIITRNRILTKLGVAVKTPVASNIVLSLLKNSTIVDSVNLNTGDISAITSISCTCQLGDLLTININGNPEQEIAVILS